MFAELANKMSQTETRQEAMQEKMEIKKRDNGKIDQNQV